MYLANFLELSQYLKNYVFCNYNNIFVISILLGGIIYFFSNFSRKIYSKKEIFYGSIYLCSTIAILLTKNLIIIFSLFELMALTSAGLIFLSDHKKSEITAKYYLTIHLISGSIILIGIILFAKLNNSFILENLNFDLSELKFSANSLSFAKLLIILGLMINSACFPFSNWPINSYPKASNNIMILLANNTTKAAVFFLITYAGKMQFLGILGLFMILYGPIYGLLNNNLSKILCCLLIEKIGSILINLNNISGNHSNMIFLGVILLSNIIANSYIIYINGMIFDKYKSQNISHLKIIFTKYDINSILYIISLLNLADFPLSINFLANINMPKLDYHIYHYKYIVIISKILKILCSYKIIYYLYSKNDLITQLKYNFSQKFLNYLVISLFFILIIFLLGEIGKLPRLLILTYLLDNIILVTASMIIFLLAKNLIGKLTKYNLSNIEISRGKIWKILLRKFDNINFSNFSHKIKICENFLYSVKRHLPELVEEKEIKINLDLRKISLIILVIIFAATI